MTSDDRIAELRAARRSGDPQEIVDAIPYLQFLGVRAAIDPDGSLICRLVFQDKVIGNPTLPAIHGGVIGGLLESVALLQLIWTLEGDTIPRTVNTSMDFLRTGQPKDVLAKGRITKQGRRVANVRCEAWQDDPSRPIAAAHGHFLLG